MHSTVDVAVAADVVLVTVTFENTESVAQRVRLRNRLDGPVLPPRRAGVPEPGWDDDGFEGVVPADATLALGFACPTDDGSPPPSDITPDAAVGIEVLGRDADPNTARPTPTDAIRRLGPSRPPADAVPATESLDGGLLDDGRREDGAGTVEDETVDADGDTARARAPGEPTDEDVAVAMRKATESVPSSHTEPDAGAEPELEPEARARAGTEPKPEARARAGTELEAGAGTEPPATPSSFLAAVERRIRLAERLDGASVGEAAAALDDADVPVDAVGSLATDRARLRRLAARATELADRAADADPDVDALRRVA